MNIHNNQWGSAPFLFFLACLFLTACSSSDTTPPTVCTASDSSLPSVLMDEVEAEAGSSVTITDTFCDDEGLSEVRWDLHSAEGHAHGEDGEMEDEGFVLHSGTSWAELEVRLISGTSSTEEWTVDVPADARGVWDIVASLVDEEGNAATDVVCQLHVENDFIPEFNLTLVNGVDPATWEGEPEWAEGTTVTLEGTVSDSDGLSSASISLVQESDELEVWSAELTPDGATDLPFSVEVTIPVGASGEYHLEMVATDLNGVTMETGFHAEVE